MMTRSEDVRQQYLERNQGQSPMGAGGSETLYCPNCGQAIPGEALFCPACGAAIPEIPAWAPAAPLPVTQPAPSAAFQRVQAAVDSLGQSAAAVFAAARAAAEPLLRSKKTWLMLAAGMGVCLLMTVVGMLGYLLWSGALGMKVTLTLTPTPQIAIAFATGRGQAITVATDFSGKALLVDPSTGEQVLIEVQSSEDRAPLAGIAVSYISDGERKLVIASDPSGQRAPVITQPGAQGSSGVIVVIDMPLLSSFGSAQAIMDFYRNNFTLVAWQWRSEQVCLPPAELAAQLSAEKQAGMLFVPLVAPNEAARQAAQSPRWAPALLALFQSILARGPVIADGLPSDQAFRLYRLAPLQLTLAEWQGSCAPPKPTPQMTSTPAAADLSYRDEIASEENSSSHYEYEFHTPVFASQPGLNALIERWSAAEIEKFKHDAVEIPYDPDYADVPSSLDGQYTIVYAENNLVSIQFKEGIYISMAAHPMGMVHQVNYDAATQREIAWDDAFLPGALPTVSAYCADELTVQGMGEWLSEIPENIAPTPDNFEHWNFDASGLVITFEEYQVGPYVAGSPSVRIPYAALQEYLRADGPLGGFIR